MNIDEQAVVHDAIHEVVASSGFSVLKPTRDAQASCNFFAVVGYKDNHQYAINIPFSDIEVASLKICPSHLATLRAEKALQRLRREMGE